MKFKIAKGGTIHTQHSMFATDERDLPAPTDDEIYEANRGKPGQPDLTPHPARAVTNEHLFNTFLTAYRTGERIEDVKVSVADGKWLPPDEVLIISPDKRTAHGWISTRNRAHNQYADEVREKAQSPEETPNTPPPADLSAAKLIVSAEVGYEAMMDALRDNIDPLMVEVETDCGERVRLCSCTVRGIGGVQMSVYDLLKLVRMDRQDEILAAREEDAEPVPTHDWSM